MSENKVLYLSLIANILLIFTLLFGAYVLSLSRDYNQELKEELSRCKDKSAIFEKLSYSLSDYCIDLENERAHCNLESKECK